MFRILSPLLAVLLAATGCTREAKPPPLSPFHGRNTADVLRSRLVGEAELDNIFSRGSSGPPSLNLRTYPAWWSQETDLTVRGTQGKNLLSTLRTEVLARIQKSTWLAAEPKDGPDSFSLDYSAGDYHGQISVKVFQKTSVHVIPGPRVIQKKEDAYSIWVQGEEKSLTQPSKDQVVGFHYHMILTVLIAIIVWIVMWIWPWPHVSKRYPWVCPIVFPVVAVAARYIAKPDNPPWAYALEGGAFFVLGLVLCLGAYKASVSGTATPRPPDTDSNSGREGQAG